MPRWTQTQDGIADPSHVYRSVEPNCLPEDLRKRPQPAGQILQVRGTLPDRIQVLPHPAGNSYVDSTSSLARTGSAGFPFVPEPRRERTKRRHPFRKSQAVLRCLRSARCCSTRAVWALASSVLR